MMLAGGLPMAATAKVIAIGNSVGIVLPKEILAKLNVEKGDTLYLNETPDGFQLSPFDEEFAAKMAVADSLVRRYRDAFKKLAE
jgi:putative addiction module antidote